MTAPAMNWTETWNLAIEALRANKVRSALTMLGVVIGSACIVLVVTVGLTGRSFVRHQIEAVGSNVVFANLGQPSSSRNVALGDQISLADLDAVRRDVSQVIRVAGTNDMPMSVVAAGKSWPVSLVGVTQGFQEIRNLILISGRYFDDADFVPVSKVCVLSEHLAKIAFPEQNPIGQTIHVGELTFTVIGVFRERVETFGQSEIRTDSLLVPLPLVRYYTGDAFIVTLYAQAATSEDVAAVTEGVAMVLRNRHGPIAEYNVENLSSILETSRRISIALTIVLMLVALLALLISGIGIMNIMLVSVTERTHEIGIRKAIGARRREILYQFLCEAIIISGAGALIGIGIAIAIPIATETVVRFLALPGELTIPISWVSVVFAFVVSCSIGVLFGYLPARTAARLQPVESLRFE